MTRFDHDGYSPSQSAGLSNPAVSALLLFVCLALGMPVRAGTLPFEDPVNTAAELHLSQPVTGNLSASAPLHYWFHSDSNSVFKLGVEQHDMKLRVTVVGPDGASLLERLTPISAATPVVAVANLAGTYSVTVTPQQTDERSRQFSICLEEIGRRNLRRSAELSASTALEGGDRLSSQWTHSSLDNALARYRCAEKEWRRAGDLEEASSALVRQGDVHAIRGQYKAALSSYQEALQLVSSGSRVDRKIDILNAMAALALEFVYLEEAKKDAIAANNLSISISYDEGRGRSLTEMGGVEFYRTNSAAAQSYLDQAMSIWARIPDRQGEVFTLAILSYISLAKSDHASAFEYLTRALTISKAIDDEYSQARAVLGIGNYYVRVDELAQARDSFNASLNLLAKMGSVNLEAAVLDGFGYYLENLGDRNSFALYKRAALLQQRAAEHPLMYAFVLNDLSRAALANGKASEALQYAETERRLALGLHDGLMISQSLRDVGEAYMAAGNASLALKFFTAGMDPKLLGPNSAGRANTEIEIARALERLGRAPEALDAYREAASLSHSIASMRAEADALYHIARLDTAEGRLDSALPEIAQSVSLVESLRTRVSADDTRIMWFASFHSIYTLYIDVLMQLSSQKGDDDMARQGFRIAEQSIARSFVELLHGAQVYQGDSPDLAHEDASVRRLLAEKKAEENRLLGASISTDAVHKIASEISDLHDRAVEIESQLQGNNPEYFRMQIDPVAVDKVQSLIGDEDLVLEYSLGSSHSYLWAINKTGFSSYALPPEGEIEALVRLFRQAVVSPGPQTGRVASPSKGYRENEMSLALELGRTLLAPVPDLDRFKRIVVVADGALQYLPFGVLITKPARHDSARLADNHEITNLPSMTALSVLRSRRNLNRPPAKGLVLFADPVFESDDPRIERIDPANYKSAPKSSSANKEIATDPAGYGSNTARHFPRLPGSRQEAAAIAEITPRQNAEILLGFDANRSRAENKDLQNYRFIHFATHSVFDDEHPESSGVILSLFNHDGSPEDGYLRLRDIYGLKLSADMVVLSACDTALGKIIKGEGIVGLTRGFMYAGAPRVVATLWRVDDDATSEFMKWFYMGIFQKQESPVAALREAQLEMRKQTRWRAPYYWGGFVIEGDWRSTNESISEVSK
jgi:CHAT domain-containing protein/tetratricopeptide (TPR) repeat protein